MIYVLVLVTFYYTDGIHEEGSICQVREEDFDARFMKKLKSPWENIYSKTEVDELLNAKQNTLIEGTGIDIDEDDEISCTVEPSTVTVTQVQTTGTKIATIDVDGVDTDIYAPEGGSGLAEDVIADEFDTTPTVVPNVYNKNDFCTYSGYVYVCQKNNVTSEPAWGSSDWQQAGTSVITSFPAWVDQNAVFKKNSTYYQNTGAGVFAQSASEITSTQQVTNRGAWSSGTSTYHQYSAGDFCMHEGGLYKCTASTTGQSWNSSKWSATQVTDELGGGGSGGSATILDLYNEQGTYKISLEELEQSQNCVLKEGTTAKTAAQIKTALESGAVIIKDSYGRISNAFVSDTGNGINFIGSVQSQTYKMYYLYYSGGLFNVQSMTNLGGSTTLAGLTDTNITSASNGQVLTYDGTKWKNATPSSGGSATKFSLYNQSVSTAVSFRDVTQGSTFKFTVSGTQKDLVDIINAFDNGGAIIVDADSSEAKVNGVIDTAQGAFFTIIATCGNGDIKLINFNRTSSKTFNCTLSRSLGS